MAKSTTTVQEATPQDSRDSGTPPAPKDESPSQASPERPSEQAQDSSAEQKKTPAPDQEDRGGQSKQGRRRKRKKRKGSTSTGSPAGRSSIPDHEPLAGGAGLEQLEDQLLLGEQVEFFEALGLGELVERLYLHPLEVGHAQSVFERLGVGVGGDLL